MKKLRTVFLGTAIFLTLIVSGIDSEAKQGDTIREGILIGNIDVSGLTQEEAQEKVSQTMDESLQVPITLECVGDHTVTVTPVELGMTWNNTGVINEAASVAQKGDVVTRYKAIKDLQRENMIFPLQYDFDKELIRALVEEKCDAYNEKAVNFSLKLEDGVFRVIEGKEGKVLDNEASIAKIYEYLTEQWDGTESTIALPVVIDEPKGNEEELSKVKDILGTFSTSYHTSGSDRSANVANGCRLVNGTTVYPGETFSTYDAIKPFSIENGYYMAGSYVNGMVVDSLGGGICQVSTTLYNAVLRSELEIVERNNHSMVVNYVPVSADAAIAESSGKDFKFINNTDYPIYIEGITTPEKEIIFNIYGVETRKEGRRVDFQSEILETITPDRENIIQDASLPVGVAKIQSVHIGYKARLWKIVTVNGVEESREVINNSNYKMVPRTATVGVATDNQEAYNQIQAAIATGSIDQVKAVSDAWAAASAAAAQQQASPPAEQVPDV